MSWVYNRPYSGRQQPKIKFRIKRKTASLQLCEETDFLMHYGIQGQKWGVRRFQNEDGTLTEAGKDRYYEDRPESETWKKRDAKRLSDEELRRRVNRLNAEKQYRDLTTSDIEKERKQITKDAIKRIFIGTATATLVGVMAKNYKSIIPIISKYGKRTIASLKNLFKNTRSKIMNRNMEKYSYNRFGPTIEVRDRFQRTPINKSRKTTYTYRPRNRYPQRFPFPSMSSDFYTKPINSK